MDKRRLNKGKCVKVLLISKHDNSIIKSFNSIKEASEITGTPVGTIGSIVIKKGATKNPDCTFVYEKDFRNGLRVSPKTTKGGKTYKPIRLEQKETIKREAKEYYVNVLVGLANGTLEDGAVYKINDCDLTYNKELNRLETNGASMLSQQEMWKEIEVELPLLHEEERKFLKTLLKAFGEIKGIRKCNGLNLGYEFIRIEATRQIDTVDLPEFTEGKYYASLEQNRLYTIEELGL